MDALLECRGLTKSYGRKTALSGVDLTISRGKIVGLLGPNGSGKTTLIKLACGLLTPTAGQILVEGKEPGVESRLAISYLPDKNYLNDYIIGNNYETYYKTEGNAYREDDIVCDFIASMTDDYFLEAFAYLFPNDGLNSLVKRVDYFDKRFI